MPSAKSAMYAALSQDPAIVAVVGDKVFIDDVPQTDGTSTIEEPYLVFESVSDIKPLALNSTIGIRKVRFQVTAYCATRAQAKSLQDAIESLLHGKKHHTFGGLTVKASFASQDDGAADETETPRPGEEFGLRVLRVDVLWWV